MKAPDANDKVRLPPFPLACIPKLCKVWLVLFFIVPLFKRSDISSISFHDPDSPGILVANEISKICVAPPSILTLREDAFFSSCSGIEKVSCACWVRLTISVAELFAGIYAIAPFRTKLEAPTELIEFDKTFSITLSVFWVGVVFSIISSTLELFLTSEKTKLDAAAAIWSPLLSENSKFFAYPSDGNTKSSSPFLGEPEKLILIPERLILFVPDPKFVPISSKAFQTSFWESYLIVMFVGITFWMSNISNSAENVPKFAIPWLNSNPFEINRLAPFNPFKSSPSLCWAFNVFENTNAISSKSPSVVWLIL